MSTSLPSADRQALMQVGIGQLEVWLRDLIRIGLIQFDFSEESLSGIASRLVDAKLGAIARRIRRLSTIERSDPQWFLQILNELSYFYLLVRSMRKLNELPADLLQTLYLKCGVNIKKADLPVEKAISDIWIVVGIEYQTEENLRSRYTWIMGRKSKRTALLLDFAFGRRGFETNYVVEKSYRGALIYFPGALPLRGYLKHPDSVKSDRKYPGTFSTVDKFLYTYANALCKNPWIRDFPACLGNMSLIYANQKFRLVDLEGKVLPISTDPAFIWPVFSVTAGAAFQLFGIWNGFNLRILSAQYQGEFYQLS